VHHEANTAMQFLSCLADFIRKTIVLVLQEISNKLNVIYADKRHPAINNQPPVNIVCGGFDDSLQIVLISKICYYEKVIQIHFPTLVEDGKEYLVEVTFAKKRE